MDSFGNAGASHAQLRAMPWGWIAAGTKGRACAMQLRLTLNIPHLLQPIFALYNTGKAFEQSVARTAHGPKPPIETDAGNLTHNELQSLVQRRHVANGFVSAAIVKAESIPSMENNSFYEQMLQQQIARQQFGFGHVHVFGNGWSDP